MLLNGTSSDENKHGPSSHVDGDDAAGRIHHQQAKMQLENHLRVKKLEVNDRNHKQGEIEREITHLNGEVHHLEQSIKDIEREFHQLETTARKDEDVSKHAQDGIREKDTELRRRSDETVKLEHEINLLRLQIITKEHAIAELKEETRGFMKGKEELRRTHELEHFSANNEAGHAHEKGLQVQRFKQDLMRKQNEIEHKGQELARLKQETMMREQDIADIEAELRRG